jgi:ABC-type molybdate transport system substrate-binding protein
LLEANLTKEEVQGLHERVKVHSPTGDLLVTHISASSLDAAIVYRSNANAAKDKVGVIPITLPKSMATQPVGISRSSEFKQLTGRLFDALRSETSMKRFKDAGFNWKMDETSGGTPPTPLFEEFGGAPPKPPGRTEQ